MKYERLTAPRISIPTRLKPTRTYPFRDLDSYENRMGGLILAILLYLARVPREVTWGSKFQ